MKQKLIIADAMPVNRFEEIPALTWRLRTVSLDMNDYECHYSLQVYTRNKPKKWEYKSEPLAGQSGRLHKFYASGDNLVPSNEQEIDPAVEKSGKVILNLLSHLPKDTHVHFNNYLALPKLLL